MKTELAKAFERSCNIQRNQAAVANHVHVDNRYHLPPIWLPFS